MNTQVSPTRQEQLDHILAEGLKNPTIREAMKAFRISEHEYARAISGTVIITTIDSDKSTPKDATNAHMDSGQARD